MIYPDQIGPILGDATLVIQDHAESDIKPAPREIPVKFTRIEQNPDGSFTLPNGSVVFPK